MNEKLAKWKEEKARLAEEKKKSTTSSTTSSGSSSSKRTSATKSRPVPSAKTTTRTVKPTAGSIEQSAPVTKAVKSPSKNKTQTQSSTPKVQDLNPQNNISSKKFPPPNDIPSPSIKSHTTKLETELAYSQLLQAQYLRFSLSKAATVEQSCAEEDILRAWQQVNQAENHLNQLQAQEKCYLRKIEMYNNLKQLDTALAASRGVLIEAEEPLEAVISLENDLDNIVIFDSRVDSHSQQMPSSRSESTTSSGDLHNSLPDMFKTLIDSLTMAREELFKTQTNKSQISSQLESIQDYHQPFQETASTIKHQISPQLVELDQDISTLWTRLIGNKFRSEGGDGDSYTVKKSAAHIRSYDIPTDEIETNIHHHTSPDNEQPMKTPDKSAVTSPRTSSVSKKTPVSHKKVDSPTTPSLSTISPSEMKTIFKNL